MDLENKMSKSVYVNLHTEQDQRLAYVHEREQLIWGSRDEVKFLRLEGPSKWPLLAL